MIKKLILLLILLVFSSVVCALGLGGIAVKSALNEPLDARIALISASSAEIEDIRVKLADAAVFRRAGVERSFLLSKLRFKAVAPEQGKPYIQVTTRESIREPFLDFLIEISWPNGSLVREFTVLLDPPTYTPPQAKSAAVAPKRTVSTQPAQSQPSSGPATYGPVRSSETLWVIAGKVQPDKGISRNQTMVALLKSNPDAFQNGNINLLKKGVLLTVPSAAEITSLGKSEALATVKQQMAEWRQQREKPPVASKQNLADSDSLPKTAVTETKTPASTEPTSGAAQQQVAEEMSPEPSAAESAAQQGQRLRVVDADRSWQLSNKSELGYPTQESDKLREAIKDSEQDLVAVQDISKDIVELRAALESKVLALKKALDEKDAQLESLRKQIEQVGMGGASATAGQPGMSGSAAVLANSQGNVTADTPMAEQRPLESYWKDQYWMILMGIIIIILASMLLFGRRRRENADVFEAPDLFQMSSEQVLVGDNPISEPVAMIDELLEAPLESRKATPRTAASDSAVFPEAEADIASILTEADIYLAYRRYTQAETLIEEAMTLNPESPELKAKLLEIYAFRRDKKGFSRYLDQVYPVLMIQSPELWEKIVEMGSDLVPEHPAWSSEGEMPPIDATASDSRPQEIDDLSDSDDPLDMDIDLDINLDDMSVLDTPSVPSLFDDVIDEPETLDNDDISIVDIDFDDLDDSLKDK